MAALTWSYQLKFFFQTTPDIVTISLPVPSDIDESLSTAPPCDVPAGLSVQMPTVSEEVLIPKDPAVSVSAHCFTLLQLFYTVFYLLIAYRILCLGEENQRTIGIKQK